MINRRRFLLGGLAGLFGSAGLAAAYTRLIEPHWVDYCRKEMAVPDLPAFWEERTMVQISDLHVGPFVRDDYLRGVFRRIGDMKPDILVATGDFVTYRGREQLGKLRALLKDLPLGRRASVAVLGNHDYGPGWTNGIIADRVKSELESRGVRVLRNEVHTVEGLQFIGMDDLWSTRLSPETAFNAWDPGAAAVALCHNPDSLDKAGWSAYRGWVLAGHTHGGQCKIPFMKPPLMPIVNTDYAAGEIVLDDGRRLYVNRGVGHILPVRFNARPEVTIFRLRRG